DLGSSLAAFERWMVPEEIGTRVHSGVFLRTAVRRAKQVRFRRERVVVEGPPEESAGSEQTDDDSLPERIEVHVHLHREGKPSSRSKRVARPVLTGTLFDWQWYTDRIAGRPRNTIKRRWSLATLCQNCDSIIPSSALRCRRCAAPRPRRRLFGLLIGLA